MFLAALALFLAPLSIRVSDIKTAYCAPPVLEWYRGPTWSSSGEGHYSRARPCYRQAEWRIAAGAVLGSVTLGASLVVAGRDRAVVGRRRTLQESPGRDVALQPRTMLVLSAAGLFGDAAFLYHRGGSDNVFPATWLLGSAVLLVAIATNRDKKNRHGVS